MSRGCYSVVLNNANFLEMTLMTSNKNTTRRDFIRIRASLSMCLLGVSAVPALAAPAVIRPSEATSNDTFIYAFLPTTNFNSGGSSAGLVAGKAEISATNHDLRTLIRFDLSGRSIDAGETATLNLYVTDVSTATSQTFVTNPSANVPVIIDMYLATQAWNESTVTWNTQPTFAPTPFASTTIFGINRWASWNITAQAQAWIADANSNLGVVLLQRDFADDLTTTPPKQANAAFIASGFTQAGPGSSALWPNVVIPEPATLLVISGGLGLLVLRRRGR